jgi:2-octaprenyl-6-methoxyphenol hydroxylase
VTGATYEAFDVAIVGGGLVGASLAAALAPGGRRIALIEQAPPSFAAPAWDERCIGLNDASVRILCGLGAWRAIRPDAEPIVSTHISERGRFGVARVTAAEAGLEALGYNTPLRAIHQALLARVLEHGNVEMLCPETVHSLQPGSESVAVVLAGSRLSARLVIAADGARSVVRSLLGIGADTRDYGQTAVTTSVRPTRPHRNVAYERFTPDGPIAVLPRPDGSSTVVWMLPPQRAQEALGWSGDTFLEKFQSAFGNRLGRFTAVGQRAAYPLARVMAHNLTAPRVVFAGNAAQTLHPVAAQGFNLGLRDAATLADLLTDPGDPGRDDLLAEYVRRRQADRRAVAGFTDTLVRLFSNAVPGLRGLRHLGILALDLLPPIKQHVTRQNLGYGDRPPQLARAAHDAEDGTGSPRA